MANAGQIKEHMEVIGADGKHHNIPLAWVDHIDEHVHLNKNCADVQRQWETA